MALSHADQYLAMVTQLATRTDSKIIGPIAVSSWDHVNRLNKNLSRYATQTRVNADGWCPSGRNVLVSAWYVDPQGRCTAQHILQQVPLNASIRSAL